MSRRGCFLSRFSLKESLDRMSVSTFVSVLFILVIVLGSGLGYELATNHSATTFTKTVTATSYLTETTAPPSIFSLELGNINVSDYGTLPPRWIASDPNLGIIYLSGGSNIMTLDAKTLSIEGNYSIPGTGSYLFDINQNTNTLFVLYSSCGSLTGANCNDSNVRTYIGEINGTSGVILRQFPLPNNSWRPAVDYQTNIIYETQLCPNPSSHDFLDEYLTNCGYLLAVNGTTGDQLANISLGQEPESTAVDQTTNTIYTTDGNDLLIINGTTDSIKSSTSLKFSDSSPVIRVDAASNTVFVLGANGTDASTILVALNGTSGQILYFSTIGSACLVNTNGFYVNSITNQIYASAGLSTDNLVYINAGNGKITNIVSMPRYNYVDSTFNPKLDETYVLLNDTVVTLPSHLSQYYDNASSFDSSFCPGPLG